MKKLLFVVLVLLFCATLVTAQEPIYDHFVYLPAVVGGSGGTATPTPTVTATIEPTATITVFPPPTGTPPWWTATPTPGTIVLPTVTPRPILRFITGEAYEYGTSLYVLGDIHADYAGVNPFEWFASVPLILYDDQGSPIYVTEVHWSGKLLPGGHGCFSVRIWDAPEGWASYDLGDASTPGWDTGPLPNLELSGVQGVYIPMEGFVVSGTVTNNELRTVSLVRYDVALRDVDGRVVGCLRHRELSSPGLVPGMSLPFSCRFGSSVRDYSDVVTYTVRMFEW